MNKFKNIVKIIFRAFFKCKKADKTEVKSKSSLIGSRPDDR